MNQGFGFAKYVLVAGSLIGFSLIGSTGSASLAREMPQASKPVPKKKPKCPKGQVWDSSMKMCMPK